MARGCSDTIYLDWNATTPLLPAVIEAMSEAASRCWGNPASVHAHGRQARAEVENTRELLAQLLGTHARDVLFCSGGTEANNLALQGVVGVLVSQLDHPSITRRAESLARQGTPVEWLSIPTSGIVEPASVLSGLKRLPLGSTVVLTALNHETGVLQPVREIYEVVASLGGHLHVDAVQALGKVPTEGFTHFHSCSVTAHKIRGPKGIGALTWRTQHTPEPILVGGAQERGLRPGTVDAVSAVGFRVALEQARTNPTRYSGLAPRRDRLEQYLLRYAQLNGAAQYRASHVSNLSFAGWRGDELVVALDLAGVQVASGSACSAGTQELSPVISAMLGPERARSAVRISLGDETSDAIIDQAISIFERVLRTPRQY